MYTLYVNESGGKRMNIFKFLYRKLVLKYRPYYSHLDYFQNLSDQITIDYLISNLSYSSNYFETNQNIQINGINFNSRLCEIIDKKKKPSYKTQHKNIKELATLFYRKKIDGHKATMMLVLFESKLIFASYIFDHITRNKLENILDVISVKYLNEIKTISSSSFICDTFGNKIQYVEGIDSRINFASGDREVFHKLGELKHAETMAAINNAKLAYSNL